jgi:predicted DCC family thiol-disulfide oxidoreductase YuxK
MPEAPAFPLQVFYDGSCSVCATEMAIYMRKEHGGRLIFVDVSSPDFDPAPHGIAMEAFMHEMHAIDRQGRVYRGVEAFWAIWHAFPTSTWYGFLRTLVALPGVNLLARLAYRGFARIRKYLPKHHGGCDAGVCRRGHDKPPA